MKTQILKIRLTEDCGQIALTGYDGRISIQKLIYSKYKNFSLENILSFKAVNSATRGTMHEKPLYQINDFVFLSKNSLNNSAFVSASSEGIMSFWNKKTKYKIRTRNTGGIPITNIVPNSNHKLMIVAMGYDWSKGVHELRKIDYHPLLCVYDIERSDLTET